MPSLQTVSSLCKLGLSLAGIRILTVCITPWPHHINFPNCSGVPELIHWKGWWRRQPTRSVLDNLVLVTSLVRPWWEAPTASGKGRLDSQEGVGNFCPAWAIHSVCDISCDYSPNITQIPTIQAKCLNSQAFWKSQGSELTWSVLRHRCHQLFWSYF